MSLEDLGNIGEFVAAVAVVVSLIYLAVQIRQNTISVRLSNYLASETLSSESARPIVEDPALARLWRIGLADFRSLDDDEKIRFTTLFQLQFRAYEQMFLQHRRGLIDPEVWEARRAAMLQWISAPGVQAMWKLRRHSFTKSFREHLEQAGRSGDDRVAHDEPVP